MSSWVMIHSANFRPRRRAFTLIEAMMVTVIIGVGVMSMLELLATGTLVNGESTELTTAVNLANNINELCVRTQYQDLRTAVGTSAGRVYDPPVDGRGQPLIRHANWSQLVTVQYVEPHRVTAVVPDSQVEPTSRVTIQIRRYGRPIYTTSLLVAAAQWPPP